MVRFADLSAVLPGLAALCVLSACKPAPATLDPAADPIARQFYDEVRIGGDLDADPHLAHELKNPTTEAQLAEFRSLIPDAQPISVALHDWDAKVDGAGETTRLTEVYRYPDRTLIAQTALFKSPDGRDPVIVGFKLSEADAPGDAGGS